MPGMTSLGIVYPCGGDTIDTGVFADYAESTQTALTATQALVDDALQPPMVWARTDSAGQVVAAGATTVMTYAQATLMYDTAAMYNAGTPTLITIPEAGTYLANCWVTLSGSATTETSHRAAILVNGVEFAFHKQDVGTFAGGTSAPLPFFVSAMLPSLAAGAQITTTHLFTGTGNATLQHSLAVTKISNV